MRIVMDESAIAFKRRHALLLAGILVFAALVRGYFFSRTSGQEIYAPWYREAGDAISYNNIAVNLVQGRGFSHDGAPTADRPPLYPFFLAAIYKTFGRENFSAVRI